MTRKSRLDKSWTPQTEASRPLGTHNWIRGVNIGGYLILERYITPYTFGITSCHREGKFCWYKGQIDAPPSLQAKGFCPEISECQPYLTPNVYGNQDYPFDEYNLGLAFAHNKTLGEEWINSHLEHFLTYQDLQNAKNAGVTHLRVPLPHWIMGDIHEDEPWLLGQRWTYFGRMVQWARELDLQVWPDIHTAPGSQNGFDNSGHQLADITCDHWMDNPDNVQRSLNVIADVTRAIVKDNMTDVVTGFGLLNEPFKDCDIDKYLDFINHGLSLVRKIMGHSTHVYVSDLFRAKDFNNGTWWLDPIKYNNTYLDSHYYHVFAQSPRELSPRQHIAYTCVSEYKTTEQHSGTASCCYDDGYKGHSRPSHGVRRLVGEWSAATDTLPVAKLSAMMQNLAANGTVGEMDRKLSPERQSFLQHFVEAQMVTYEAHDRGVSDGWFFWTLKMEGGAFAEWDFLRGVHEGWVPQLANIDQTSQDVYGSCYDIMFRTADNSSIIDPFPPHVDEQNNWQGVRLDDDVVVSHGNSLLHGKESSNERADRHSILYWSLCCVIFLGVVGVLRVLIERSSKRQNYTRVDTETSREATAKAGRTIEEFGNYI